MSEIIRVLVVDDSAYVRKVVSAMLSRSPFIDVVGTARDGEEALERAAELKPDVITCDLNMPVMDGVAFVREQMRRSPVPILILSIAAESAEQVLAALDAGAVDFVQKPTALATERLMDISDEVVQKVKTAARVGLASRLRVAASTRSRSPDPDRARSPIDVVVLGISTGGPQGLKRLIPALPKDFRVPIAMVMHMPLGYTEMYAAKLNEMCALTVVEAREGDEVRAGTAYLAPAGRHLVFRRNRTGITTGLDLTPLDTAHRPSVDVLFHSAAQTFGSAVLGVVMTGMGSDGREGAGWIKSLGGNILAEAEESCVVYGMPRAVVEAGLADEVVPLECMAAAIMERL
ncbi:MAG TPA: chemotaxis response regulator protein-glutamate methylesterase [Vicinamibacterales bacterium]|jgi:two-component system, chemotaxis family, protein-glutamate methylesterase/glutaminase|nr:chemotaxis response regulator protein-glutamate methylesterase [Vicinamibacterales bacterium]